MFAAIIFVFISLACFIQWQYQWSRKKVLAFWILLLIKISAAFSMGYLYQSYYGGGDTFTYFYEADKVYDYLQTSENSITSLFIQGYPDGLLNQSYFPENPRARFFALICASILDVSGFYYYNMAVLFAIVSFLSAWWLLMVGQRFYPKYAAAWFICLFCLPTVVFWTSGIIKETVAGICFNLCFVCTILALNKKHDYSAKYFCSIAAVGLLFLLSIICLWKIRFFYAATFLPLLLLFIVLKIAWFYKISINYFKTLVLAAIFMLTASLFLNFFHPISGPGVLINVLELSRERFFAKEAVDFSSFLGTEFNIWWVVSLPWLVFSGLFRPMVGEETGLLNLFAGLENLTYLLIFIYVIYLYFKGYTKKISIFTVPAFIFIAGLAYLITLATPDFGSLLRYKTGYLPVFIFLVIKNINFSFYLNSFCNFR